MIVDMVTNLTQIGFTRYENKVYLVLLRENSATCYQISKTSGMLRSMVYEGLSRPCGRGAVLESVEDRATQYRPIAPELLFEHHEPDHRQPLSNLWEHLNTLYVITDIPLVVADGREPRIASKHREVTATITRNANLLLCARQFVWMELFTQRVYARLKNDLLEGLEPQNRQIFESLNALKETPNGKRNMDKQQHH